MAASYNDGLALINQNIPDNTEGLITPAKARDVFIMLLGLNTGSLITGRNQFIGATNQTTYQNDDLLGAQSLVITVEGMNLAEGSAANQYQFNPSSGTVTFGQSVEGQAVIIIYFK